MRLPPHETGFDLANSQHPTRYRDNAIQSKLRRAGGGKPVMKVGLFIQIIMRSQRTRTG